MWMIIPLWFIEVFCNGFISLTIRQTTQLKSNFMRAYKNDTIYKIGLVFTKTLDQLQIYKIINTGLLESAPSLSHNALS